jgi:excisionase family DNA binding protein
MGAKKRDPIRTRRKSADDLMGLTEAAALAGVDRRWMWQLVSRGTLPGMRIGRVWLVSRTAVQQFQRLPNMGRPKKQPPAEETT